MSAHDFAARVAAPLAGRLATGGTAFTGRGARNALVAAVLLGGLLVVGTILLFVALLVSGAAWLANGVRLREIMLATACVTAVTLPLLAILLAIVWKKRGDFVRNAYGRLLYANTALATLAGLSVEHVFCATDIQFAEHVYLSPRFLYAYRLGVGTPDGDLGVADAVLASAAFPAAFPPLMWGTERFAFGHGADQLPVTLALLDGGIYDNMGDQWFLGMRKRLSGQDGSPHAEPRALALRAVSALQEEPDELLIVNGSAGLELNEVVATGWLRGEFDALLRAILALHDNSCSLRRNKIVQAFIAAEASGTGQRGTLIHIGTNPWLGVNRAAKSGTVAQRERAKTLESLLNLPLGPLGSAIDWPLVVKGNMNMGTTLFPLGVEQVARLLQHAYILSAVQTHLYLAYPLPPRGDWQTMFEHQRFLRLAEGKA